MGGTLITSLVFGMKFASILVAPIFFIQYLNFTPIEFGWITSLSVVTSYTICGIINSQCVERFGAQTMLRIGMVCPLIAGLFLGVSYLIFGLQTPLLIASLFILYCGGALVFPNAFATAFASLHKNIGYAGAFYGFMQTGGGAVLGGLISYLPDTNPLALAGTLIVFSSLNFFIFHQLIAKAPQN